MDYRAKKHAVLEGLKKDLSKGFIEEEVEIRGHKFKMHTLNEEEEGWCDAFVNMSTPSSMISSRRGPRVATSITAVDGVSLSELFSYSDDMTEEQKKNLDKDPVQKNYWYRSQMLYYLMEAAHRPFISDLAEALSKMESRVTEVVKELPK